MISAILFNPHNKFKQQTSIESITVKRQADDQGRPKDAGDDVTM